MKRPLVHIALAFASGIVLAGYFPVPISVLVVLFLVLLAALMAQFRWNLRGSGMRPVFWAVAATALLGAIRSSWEHDRLFRRAEAVYQVSRWGSVSISATVAQPIEVRGRWGRMVIRDLEVRAGPRVYELGIKALAMVPVRTEAGEADGAPTFPELLPGDRVQFQGRLNEIREESLPGAFDFREYMASQDIFARVLVWDAGRMAVKPAKPGVADRFRRLCFGLRSRIGGFLENTMPAPERDLLRAMMLGDRTTLPWETWEAMKRSGLGHLTAVSGLHFSILIGFFAGGLKLLGVRRRWAALLSIPFILVLLGVTGYRIPTIRAAIMGLILIGALLVHRDRDPLNDLALAMLVLMIISPIHLFRVGFQLSFLAVTGIILIARRLPVWKEDGHWLRNWLGIAGGVSFGAFVGTAPAIAYHFGMFTPITLVANLWAVPLATVILGLGLTASLIGLVFPSLGAPLMTLNAGLLQVLDSSSQMFTQLPGAWVEFPRLGLWWTALLYMMLLLLAVPGNALPERVREIRLRRHHYVLACVSVALWVGCLAPGRGEVAVSFLSVGQGDATLIEFPGGGTMLIDGGPPEAGEKLEGFLRSKGLRRIDAVVVTHPERDHIGGIPAVLRACEVGVVLDSGMAGEGELYEEYMTLIRDRGIPRTVVSRGHVIEGCGNVEISVLNPPPGVENLSEHALDESGLMNEYSLVLFIKYGRVGILLTGDIGHPVERELHRIYGDLDCNVLKVPHHGSRFSSSSLFLELTDPEVAVIEVGPNPYRHPAPEVVRRYGEYGALLFRTDWDGPVRFLTDGETYRIEAARSREIYVGEVIDASDG